VSPRTGLHYGRCLRFVDGNEFKILNLHYFKFSSQPVPGGLLSWVPNDTKGLSGWRAAQGRDVGAACLCLCVGCGV
jgi:hypothetical protein